MNELWNVSDALMMKLTTVGALIEGNGACRLKLPPVTHVDFELNVVSNGLLTGGTGLVIDGPGDLSLFVFSTPNGIDRMELVVLDRSRLGRGTFSFLEEEMLRELADVLDKFGEAVVARFTQDHELMWRKHAEVLDAVGHADAQAGDGAGDPGSGDAAA